MHLCECLCLLSIQCNYCSSVQTAFLFCLSLFLLSWNICQRTAVPKLPDWLLHLKVTLIWYQRECWRGAALPNLCRTFSVWQHAGVILDALQPYEWVSHAIAPGWLVQISSQFGIFSDAVQAAWMTQWFLCFISALDWCWNQPRPKVFTHTHTRTQSQGTILWILKILSEKKIDAAFLMVFVATVKVKSVRGDSRLPHCSDNL